MAGPSFIWSNGGDITDEDITTSDGYLNGPKSVEAIELLVDLYEQQAMPKLILGGGGGTNTFEGLAKGMYATITDGPWAFPIIEGQFKDFEMKTAPMPHGDGESTSVVGGENLVITQASENKQLAAEFTRYMLSEEAQLAMAEAGQISVLESLSDKMVEIEPSYEEYMNQLQTARPRPPTPAWTKIDEIIRKQVQLAVRGDMTAQEAMDEAVAQIDPLLEGLTTWRPRPRQSGVARGGGAGPAPRGSRKRRRESLTAYAFLLPGFALFCLIVAYPLARSFQISLYDWAVVPTQASRFIGLENYARGLADEQFWLSMANAGVYLLVTVPGQLVIGLALAVLLDAKMPARGLFRCCSTSR